MGRCPGCGIAGTYRDSVERRVSSNFCMMTLEQFLVGASRHLEVEVSDETFEQVREVAAESDHETGAKIGSTVDLYSLSYTGLENLIRQLFFSMGYQSVISRAQSGDAGYDVVLQDGPGLSTGLIIVIVKRYRMAAGASVVREAIGSLDITKAEQAIVVTTGHFSTSAMRLASEHHRVRLID